MCLHTYEVYIDAHLKVFQFRLPYFFTLMRFSFNFDFSSSLPSQQYKLHHGGVSGLCLFYLGILLLSSILFFLVTYGIWKHVFPVAHLAILGSMRKISKKENIKISPLSSPTHRVSDGLSCSWTLSVPDVPFCLG